MASFWDMLSPLGDLYGAWKQGSDQYPQQLGSDPLSISNLANTYQSTPGLEMAGGFGPGDIGMMGGIKAFHGSPHDFNAFDMSKIGSGEGAQAYGHGLYFADNEAVARQYRDQLTSMRVSAAQNELTRAGGDIDSAIAEVNRRIDGLNALPNKGGDADRWGRQLSIQEEKLAELNALKNSGSMSAGHMYEVNINADPAQFLDWDKPLNQQSPQVDAALQALLKSRDRMPSEWLSASPGAESRLRDAGVPGIKYLDQGSRSSGEGSRNYVVFNDKLIDIVKKYGIAGLATYMGANQLAAPQQQPPQF